MTAADGPLPSTTDPSDVDAERLRAGHDDQRAFDERTGIDGLAPHRAHLLPEEEAVGSDDPQAQAREVLRDSELRTEATAAAPGPVSGPGHPVRP